MAAKIILGIWLAAVIIASFVYMSSTQGLGETGRIIIYHVPAAWIAVLAYLMATVNSWVICGDTLSAWTGRLKSARSWGRCFACWLPLQGQSGARLPGAVLELGSRQTSIVVLLLVYGAYFALRSSIADEDRRARLSAVYAIFAFLTVPFLVFIVPRVYFSLHPT